MKKTAKVFVWIGMIIQFFLVYPIVVGVLALKKIEEAKSKDDLQTLGILTLLFCSLLGGIFMLSISDEELSEEKKETIVVKKEKCVKNVELDKKSEIVRCITQFGIYIICPMLLICLPFSISLFEMYEGVTYVPLILNCCLILLFVPILIIFCVNKQRLSGTNAVLLAILSILAIAMFVMSVVTNYCYAHITEIYQGYYGGSYKYSTYGIAWESWILFGLALATFLISLFVVILNLCTKQITNSESANQKETKITSGIERELNEAKRFFETNVITEEEYNAIRKSIIDKYYK